MREITIKNFHQELKAQNRSREELVFKCPICGTLQSAKDLINAGAGKTFEDVEKYLGFSCVGRWKNAGPFNPKAKNGNNKPGKGCDWTLGGLFQLHTCEVLTPEGKRPVFEPASPEEVKQYQPL